MNQSVPVVPTRVRAYINGKPMEAAETTFNTILPTFDTIEMYPRNYPAASQFIAGQELVAITDARRWPLFTANAAVYASTVSTSLNGDSNYRIQNLINGYVNNVGYVGSIPSTILYNTNAFPPTNQFTELSASLGYPSFKVALVNYGDSINILSSRGAIFTFTMRNAANTKSYTFTANSITYDGGTRWTFANTTLSKPTNTFTVNGESCLISYTMSLLSSFSGAVFETVFAGPISAGNPDPFAFAQMTNLNLTSLADPVSTLVYYNLINPVPVPSSNAHGNYVKGIVSYGADTYSSTFTLSSLTTAQYFYV
jgi:hypothetical protein